ncbi:ATP-dependent DNA helicase RecQ [Paenibacillus polymyxa]|uniref:protein DpdF n=1 Tax=Paenibacillus polymyxa TaxID=1406 RepID=UPI0008FCB540|nr:protein DpdF [Paenibacillus polymyxa]APB72497.1 ATP-dependent DNA helicase RecQ [Paenibacillus polymyxa]
MNEFDELQEWILNENIIFKPSNPFISRFVEAIQSGAIGMDLAALIRGVLRYESERSGGERIFLRVPRRANWPNELMYKLVGIVILDEVRDSYLLCAETWLPDWLPQADKEGPERPLFALKPRNQMKEVEGDPFLKEVNRLNYRCNAQRAAVRTVLTSPQDATILLNLPTGTGKSLCGQLPALLFSRQEGVTVVVVPTVALALDQERALMPLINRPSAYFSSSSRQRENKEIQESIMNGTQRIVFASPESVLESLDYSLQIAAERGYFKMLVIDEAHIVSGWGEGFRPAFQELAGWRKMMLRHSVTPFRTLLLSATVTEDCLETLQILFGSPVQLKMFSSVTLRPEPAYWMRKCSSRTEKINKMLEAIRSLPRPLIIYTTEVKDAEEIYSAILADGYKRIRVFHGNTGQNDREAIIQLWSKRQLDIIVATSAFGLGVDQAEVRAVIHVCIPESIDRFYQEVGRGGRDGKACLSLLIYDEEDVSRGRRMSAAQLIGVEKGRLRWDRMFARKQQLPGQIDTFLFSIGKRSKRINGRNDYNEQWNLRILTMMSRMGIIEFDWGVRGQISDSNDNITRVVRILKHHHQEESFWNEVEKYRRSSRGNDREEFDLINRLLKGEECVSDVLKDLYSINDHSEGIYTKNYVVAVPACGGCPACRRTNKLPRGVPGTSYPLQWPAENTTTELLEKYLDPVRHQLLLFREAKGSMQNAYSMREKQNMFRIIQWFLHQGIRHIVADSKWIQWIKEHEVLSQRHIFFTSSLGEHSRRARVKWQIPTLVINEQPEDSVNVFRWMEHPTTKENPVIFIVSSTMANPIRPETLLQNTSNIRFYQYEVFKQEVGI